MSIIGTKRTGHERIIPDSGYIEINYTLSVRYTGSKNLNEARRFFETELLNKHISSGDCQFIIADLAEV